ncbi:unnamed protein product [Malus baccata var. baccata]
MASEYNRFHHRHRRHHHHKHHQNLYMHNHQRSTFLPMLCSTPSIKDVSLPKSASVKDDPLSPRISCMGQVKRSNKVNGFPTPLTTHRLLTFSSNPNSKYNIISSPNNHLKYSMLKKLFSGKNLNNPNAAAAATTTTTATTNTTTRCSRRQVIVNSNNGGSGPRINNGHDCVANINLVDLDPPLPVIKRVHKKPAEEQEEEVNSLWKRRSGGVQLKGLQLKQIHHPRHLNQPITV